MLLEITSLKWVCKAACILEAPGERFLALFSFQKPPISFGSWPPSSIFKASRVAFQVFLSFPLLPSSFTFCLTLTLLPPTYKPPCDSI